MQASDALAVAALLIALPVNAFAFGWFNRTFECQPPEHFNSPERFPPVDCPLLILVRGQVVAVSRRSYLKNRNDQIEYFTSTGRCIVGRFAWTYP